ncbi:hypothetical protein [Angelakisella massiliensis]|uniref:hypothetical protein n=1 Tax=Angelakisella massiliensis TaxID=1871018 RepID=UPI001113B88F|nr:hypothetical protein [Angelakisella massiliensis]
MTWAHLNHFFETGAESSCTLPIFSLSYSFHSMRAVPAFFTVNKFSLGDKKANDKNGNGTCLFPAPRLEPLSAEDKIAHWSIYFSCCLNKRLFIFSSGAGVKAAQKSGMILKTIPLSLKHFKIVFDLAGNRFQHPGERQPSASI